MKKEFIEKLIELAEGFTIEKRNQHEEWYVEFGDTVIVDYVFREYDQEFDVDEVMYFIKGSGFYPTLLYRALEAWNKKHFEVGAGNAGWIYPDNILMLYAGEENKSISRDISDYKPNEYLTSQEQALEAVLMEVLR